MPQGRLFQSFLLVLPVSYGLSVSVPPDSSVETLIPKAMP